MPDSQGQERWYVVSLGGFGGYPDLKVTAVHDREQALGLRHRRHGGEIIGPAPDLPSAMAQEPKAFGLDPDAVVVVLDREEAIDLISRERDWTHFRHPAVEKVSTALNQTEDKT